MIPEVLVKEHEDALKDMQCIYGETPFVGKEDEIQAAKDCSAITLNHIWAALEWAGKAGWEFSYKGDCWHCLSYNPITTTELVHKYFESLKK